MKSRQRLFCITSPLQILHSIDVMMRETAYDWLARRFKRRAE